MAHRQRNFSTRHRPRRAGRRAASSHLALKTLPLAVALCFCNALQAQVINPNVDGLPQRGRVVSGAVSGALDGSTKLTLTQTGQRAVIDWHSFNIGVGQTVEFIQPNASAAVLNRVTGSTDMSRIYGEMKANGTVLLMNPNGVYFHQGSHVNVGSLIVTTGTVNEAAFQKENPEGTSFGIADVVSGSITNEGSITLEAQHAGLVALVAPSVVNKGAIIATGGRIALSGADRATVSLNGGLFEFAVPSGAQGTNATLSNLTGARLEGARILLSTGDAANLVSGVINLEGVQQASSAIVVDGNTVVLKSDLAAPSVSGASNAIEVQAGGSIQDAVNIAKVGTLGNGATIDVRAGTYTEPINSANESLVTLNKANLTLTGHDGAKLVVADLARVNGIRIEANNVTVEGMEISGPVTSSYMSYNWSNVSRGIFVGANATGFRLRNNNLHDLRNGILIDGNNGTGNVVSGNRIGNTKSGISVQYTGGAGIDISSNSEGPIGNEWGLNLNLNKFSNASQKAEAPDLAWQQHLLDLQIANSGWTVQDQAFRSSNRTNVNVATSGLSDNQGSLLTPINTIQGGINAVVKGGTVQVNDGTYAESVNINKSLTLQAAESDSRPVLELPDGTSGTLTIQASDVTVQGLEIRKQDRTADTALVTIPRGGSYPNYTIDYSNIRLNDLVFTGGRRAAFITGQDVTVENSTFNNQLRDALYFDAVAGTTTIRNNQFSGDAGSKKAILIEGFTGIPSSSGTVNITGNTLNGKDNFFVYNAWSNPASRVSLNLSNNKIVSTAGNGISIYDPRTDGASIDPASFAKLSSVVLYGNDLSGVAAGKYAVVGIDDASYPVRVNASGNWWGTTSESGVLAKTSGSVDISPFLMSGTDTDLGTAGFQGSMSNLTVTALGAQTGSTSRLKEGVDLVSAGGTVNVGAGTFVQTETLEIKKAMTLTGDGEAQTLIDARSVTGNYGLYVKADNVTLSDFTLYGPSNDVGTAYGIKVSPGSNLAAARLNNFTIRNVTSRGAGRAELDLNGVDGALIENVTLNGAPVGNDSEKTQGAGLQLTDSANVTVRNTTTLNNKWGGLAIYQANTYYNQRVSGIRIEGNNHFNEVNPVYLQDQSTMHDFGSLDIAGFSYAVRNATNASSNQYTWLQRDKQNAYDFAVNPAHVNASYNAGASYIQGWNGSGATQNFEVGVGSLSGGGSQAMSIGTAATQAASGANINVAAGTYAESVNINKALTVTGAGAGQSIIDPVSGDAVAVSGAIGADATVLIDGFTFRDASSAGVSVAGNTTLGQLTVRNSEFLNNSKFGFFVNGSETAGVPGLANVSLLNSTFVGNGASSATATSLGQGGINLNYYNGNLTLRGLTITGDGEHMGLQMRGYHNGTTVYDAGTVVFDDVTFNGSYLRPSGSAGTWNPGGPGYAIHLLEYGSVANVSFNNVRIEPTVGHGMFLEGLSSSLNIGNTRFAMPDRTITGTVTGTVPLTYSMNIVSGTNDRNNVKTHIDATGATFTGAISGFDIEDRVAHALDITGLGLATWNAGNLYVTQTSGSVQRAIDAASVDNTVNVAAGTYGGFRVSVAGLKVLGDLGDLTQVGAGANAPIINSCTAWGGGVCSSVLIDAAGVTVSGFDISNANGPYGVQIGAFGGARANNATLSYNRIHGVYGINSGDGIRAVAVEPSDNVKIQYNLIEDIRPTNAAAGSSGKSVAGIFLRSAGGAFSEALIEDNLLRNISISAATGINGAKGIWVGGSAGSASVAELTIRRNQISGVQSNVGAEGILVNHGKNSTGTTSDLLISGNVISDVVGAASSHGIELSGPTPNAQVNENDVNLATSTAANTAGVYIDTSANANPIVSGIKVSGNSLTGTGYGVDVSGNATVNASGNWWGSNSESAVAARTRGSVDFSPFLMSGTDTASSLAGFQGDKTHVRVSTQGAQSGDTGRVAEGINTVGVGGTVNVAAGTYAEDLELNDRANLLFDNVSLVGLTLKAGATGSGIGGQLTATGNGKLEVDGDLTLLADTTLKTEGRDIKLRGALQNNASTAYGLTLATNAGNGNNRGDVTLHSGGADGNALGQLSVTAKNVTVDNTLWVRNYAIDAKGNVALSNNTLKATATGVSSSLTAGGDVTGSTTSAGAVVLNGEGNVSANVTADGAATVTGRNVSGAISGSSVTATAQQVLNVAVTADGAANLNGREIRGSASAATLTARADTTMNLALDVTSANLYAGGRADLTGRAGSAVVEAKQSYFSGSFPAVEGKGTGTIFINGVPQRDEATVPASVVIVRPPIIVLPPLPTFVVTTQAPAPVMSTSSVGLSSLPATAAGTPAAPAPSAAGASGGTSGAAQPAATGGSGGTGGTGGGGSSSGGNGSTASGSGSGETGGGSSGSGSGSSSSNGGNGSSSGGASGGSSGGSSGGAAVAAGGAPRPLTVTRNAPGKAAGESLDRGQGVEVDLSPGRS